MRTHVKKKLYKERLRAKVLSQMANTANGDWRNADVLKEASAKNSYEGTRGKAGRRSRKRHTNNAGE